MEATFGGNPLSAAVSTEALKVVLNENLAINAKNLGDIFREEMNVYIEKE